MIWDRGGREGRPGVVIDGRGVFPFHTPLMGVRQSLLKLGQSH